MSNRLANQPSPYLLQHADNPVDWYPWGEAAFAAAAKHNKPIFISIGYAACHWCHVMAHESFEDATTAALLNRFFINIKVDREQHPEIDSVYMNAIQVMGEGGGWPLSAFCDSQGRPYFIGTYFPPERRYGRPSFTEVIETMARVYREEPEQVEHNAASVIQGLAQLDASRRQGRGQSGTGELDIDLVIAAGRTLVAHSDRIYGGLGGKPKFPSPAAHHLLARAARHSFGEPARAAFLLQATTMAEGGIYDHVGGGFSRYSVDEKWLVPHFEKMLYDNGQLLSVYADAYALSGDSNYLRVVGETVAWLKREMQDQAGGLYASQDADSEGVEGKYYVWNPAEIRRVLGPADSIVFCRAYGVTEDGNFDGHATVLSRVMPRGSEADEAAIKQMLERLRLDRAARRVAPPTDTKVLSSWNGLALSGLVTAWARTGQQDAFDLAIDVARFLKDRMITVDDNGQVQIARVFKDGVTALKGTLDDYAFVARAMFDVAFATGEEEYFRRGQGLLETIRQRFLETINGQPVVFLAPAGNGDHLVQRPESHADGAIPSGAAVTVECLIIVARLVGDADAMTLAEDYLATRAQRLTEKPSMGARLLGALDLYLGSEELVLSPGTGREKLAEVARRAFAPNLLWAGSWAKTPVTDLIGNIADISDTNKANERAMAYLCSNKGCQPPLADPVQLKAYFNLGAE